MGFNAWLVNSVSQAKPPLTSTNLSAPPHPSGFSLHPTAMLGIRKRARNLPETTPADPAHSPPPSLSLSLSLLLHPFWRAGRQDYWLHSPNGEPYTADVIYFNYGLHDGPQLFNLPPVRACFPWAR